MDPILSRFVSGAKSFNNTDFTVKSLAGKKEQNSVLLKCNTSNHNLSEIASKALQRPMTKVSSSKLMVVRSSSDGLTFQPVVKQSRLSSFLRPLMRNKDGANNIYKDSKNRSYVATGKPYLIENVSALKNKLSNLISTAKYLSNKINDSDRYTRTDDTPYGNSTAYHDFNGKTKDEGTLKQLKEEIANLQNYLIPELNNKLSDLQSKANYLIERINDNDSYIRMDDTPYGDSITYHDFNGKIKDEATLEQLNKDIADLQNDVKTLSIQSF